MPVTSQCASYVSNVADPEYYTHVQTSGCSGQVGPTLAFEWVKPPPDGSCVLPANVTVDRCPWSYPWSAELVFSLLIVAPLPVLLLFLLGIVAMACIRADKSSTRMVGAKPGTSIVRLTSILSHVGQQLHDGLRKDKNGQPHVRTGNLLAYLVVWLGIAAHTIVLPFVMVDADSGEVSEDACVARWMTVVASSALVLVGISLRVGEEMAADQRENDKETWTRLRLAIAVAAVLNLLAVITSSAAALTATENDNPAAVNRTETEVVSVGGRFPKLAVELQLTRCRSTKELTWAQFWAIFVPWGLMHILGLLVHCERIFRRGLRVNRFPSLLTLLLHFVFVMGTARDTEPEAMTFFVRTPIGIALGWTTLITEVIWPTYVKYKRRLPNADTLFVVKSDGTEGEKVTDRLSGLLNGSKEHHLFISYKWKTSFDKVLSLEPHPAIFTVLPLTAQCMPLGTTQVQTLYGKLKLIGGEDLKIWLDTEELKKSGQVDSESLMRHVEKSQALLVFLSEDYLTAEFCQTELRTADEAEIPIIVVCDGGVTEGTLNEEIQQFKAAKGGRLEIWSLQDIATLRAMEKLKDRVVAQWRIEKKNINEPDEGSGEIDQCHPAAAEQAAAEKAAAAKAAVLWWSRDFVRVALKGVFQQLLMCSNPPTAEPGSPLKQPNSPPKKRLSAGLPKLLFHDELLLLRKEHGKVSLFVSPKYPPDRKYELERAFKEAGTNLNITVSISPSRDETAEQRSVLLLYPGFFGTEELLKNLTRDLLIRKTNTPAPFLLYSTDMSADMSEHRQKGTDILGARHATQVFRPMWSAWPEVSSLQTVAAEEQLRDMFRAAEGTPHRARQTVEHSARELASSFKRRSSRVLPGVLSKVGSQNYVVPPKN